MPFAAALAALACGGPPDGRQNAPVVLISIDTLRADRLPPWGARTVETPAIDALARDGVLFEEAWAQVPLTLPSHVSLLTGLLPPEIGVRDNVGYRLDPAGPPTLGQRLAALGYRTGAAVSAQVLRADTGLGAAFDSFDDGASASDALTLGELQRPGRETAAAAGRFLDSVGDRPFFLLLHLFEPHAPYTPPEPFASRYADPYDGEIAAADAVVGDFVRDLERRGLYERSLVVLLSDHGEGLGDHGEREHGLLLYREALHVPLIVKLPRQEPRGLRVAAPVALVDLVPTVLAVVGAPPADGLAGRSLLPLVGAPPQETRSLYAETLYPRLHFGWSELRSLRAGRWHLIDGPDPELYDLAADPGERRNRREENRRELAELRAALAAIPFRLDGPAPADAETMARLAALGYLAAPAGDVEGPRLDPKSQLGVLDEIVRIGELARAGRAEEAVAHSRALLASQPQLTDVRAQHALTLARLGRTEEALAELRETARRAPTMLGSAALESARIELERGALEAAEAQALLALERHPREAHTLLAALALRRGDSQGAEREARAGVGDEGRPHLPALLQLSQALVQQGRVGAALDAAEEAARRVTSGASPPLPELDSTLGDLYARLGRMAEAESAFRRGIGAFPESASAYLRLAGLLAVERRFDEILPLLDRMIAAAPTAESCLHAATAVEELGNREAAAAYRQRARDLAAAAGRAERPRPAPP